MRHVTVHFTQMEENKTLLLRSPSNQIPRRCPKPRPPCAAHLHIPTPLSLQSFSSSLVSVHSYRGARARQQVLNTSQLTPKFVIWTRRIMKNMTFRRVKDSGTGSGDIYFSSSKSDSCRSMDVPSGSSDVYNYKTLAYSGGTLPRNFKKVTTEDLSL